MFDNDETTLEQKTQTGISDLYAQLLNRVEITRECRFVAMKRLTRRNKRAYYLISMLSLFVIVLSILPNIFQLSSQQSQTLLAITIVNSVFIIITTLVDATGDYSLKAQHMRASARELSIVFNRLKIVSDTEDMNRDWIQIQTDHYQSILDKCPIDHTDVDYEAVMVLKPHLFAHLQAGKTDRQNAAGNTIRVMKVHYVRARWWLPHCAMLLASFGILALVMN